MTTTEETTPSRNKSMLLIWPSNSKMRDTAECLHKRYQPSKQGDGIDNVLLAANALRQSLRFTHLISQHPGSMLADLFAL